MKAFKALFCVTTDKREKKFKVNFLSLPEIGTGRNKVCICVASLLRWLAWLI